MVNEDKKDKPEYIKSAYVYNITKFGKDVGLFLKHAIMNAKFELLIITAFIDDYGARLLANKANEDVRVAIMPFYFR